MLTEFAPRLLLHRRVSRSVRARKTAFVLMLIGISIMVESRLTLLKKNPKPIKSWTILHK